MTTAVYSRVSSKSQDTASQDRELTRWAAAQDGPPPTWYRDTTTGTTMDRPGMDRLLADVRAGVVRRVVVWRLDRLGRTARGLLELFDEFDRRGVVLVSLKDAIDSSTPAGRLMRTVLAAMAQFETEVRGERQRAGIEAARERNGGAVPWGGRKPGTRITVTPEKEAAVKEMFAAGKGASEVSRVVGLSRQTCYRIAGRWSRKTTHKTS